MDDADFEQLNQHSWGLTNGYPRRWVNDASGRHVVYMHQDILGIKLVDHRDRDKLNNQRCNLRPTTKSLNGANVPKRRAWHRKQCTSRFKGVTWYKAGNKWAAQCHVNGKHQHLGYFFDEVEAARAYDAAAIQFFGEFALLNGV